MIIIMTIITNTTDNNDNNDHDNVVSQYNILDCSLLVYYSTLDYNVM